MKHFTLGPHTTFRPEPHARHDAWHKSFSAKERRRLMLEDYRARLTFLGIMVGAVLAGMALLVFTVLGSR